MRIYEVTYEYRTRPWFHRGRTKTQKKVFSAGNQTDAYVFARDAGEKMFSRKQWKIVQCRELPLGISA